jgi:hypothetical protein
MNKVDKRIKKIESMYKHVNEKELEEIKECYEQYLRLIDKMKLLQIEDIDKPISYKLDYILIDVNKYQLYSNFFDLLLNHPEIEKSNVNKYISELVMP